MISGSQDSQGILYIVPVPIGNLKDITYRAVETLRSVDTIAAEDTRNLRELRRCYEIRTRAISYHDFNEQTRSRQIVRRLLVGESFALVSDAGTPLINDPGFRLVRSCIESKIRIVSLPGACAAVTALAASGLPVNHFRFLGFPPRTSSSRRLFFQDLRQESSTLIFYEAPHRLLATLADLLDQLGDRQIVLARNLTKPGEIYQRASITEALEELTPEEKPRGEITLLVSGATVEEQASASRTTAEDHIHHLLKQDLDTKTILREVLSDYPLNRREVYGMILAARQENRLVDSAEKETFQADNGVTDDTP